MTEENDVRKHSAREGATRDSFDALAAGLASGTITRVQALKLVGTAILGAILASLPGQAFAQGSKDGCPPASDPCGNTCCGPAEECCPGGYCCGAAEDCCAGTCCEAGKDCVNGVCVCSPELTPCGNECCDPILETCTEDGHCRNEFCDSCQAQSGQCCQAVEGGVLINQACCAAGETMCKWSGEGCLCCPTGTRCPDRKSGEAFACVSL